MYFYAREARDTSGSFEVTMGTITKTENIRKSDAWSWTQYGHSFHLKTAGEHTLKVKMKTSGVRLAKVKIAASYSKDRNSIFFKAKDSDSFTSGVLMHDATKKCMVRSWLVLAIEICEELP